MKKYLFTTLALLLGAACLPVAGQVLDHVPDSVLEEGGWQLVLERDGQQYWLFNEDKEWEEARAMCEALGSHLYWPNSIDEHLDVWESVVSGDDNIQYWTAIHQDFTAVDCSNANGGWAGPNGEPQTFFYWQGNEPTNGGNGRESVVQFEWSDGGAQWNDAPGQFCDEGNECSCRLSRVILERTDNVGCTNPAACNFQGVDLEDDGSCEFDCCPGPGCCGDGTTWDGVKCVVKQANDTNFDLCIGLTDLLDVLSGYGLCYWECGDYLNFDGYEYRTAQIGSRCWSIENLKTEHFANGDPIIRAEESNDWLEAADSLVSALCTPLSSATEEGYGYLYNGFAVRDERKICPSGWHVADNSDWFDLLYAAGSEPLSFASMNEGSGTVLKSSPQDVPGWDGGNDVGFSALNAGGRYRHGTPVNWDSWYWSYSESESEATEYLPNWRFVSDSDGVFWGSDGPQIGGSVRCVRDYE